jgi:hypothetical protein
MTYADRVKDTTTTTGIGPVTTAGSSPVGYQGISVLGGVGTSFPYAMAHVSLNEWETGIATITGTNTFSRAPTASSNGGALVPFSAGTKDVFCTAHADGLRRGLVDPDDVGYDIVLCIGQSNMVGRGTIDTLMDAVDSRVMQFGGASAQGRYRTIFSGASPTHNAETLQNTLSPQTHFGKAYAASIPANRSVLLVPCAYGGTTLVTPNFNGFTTAPWSVGSPGGSLYENAIAQANLALTEAQKTYPNSRIVGMIWHQGESDGDNNVSQSAYATALVAMIAGLRARITGAANAWFIIGGLMPEAIASNGAKYTAIRDAHIQVAAATSKCVYVAGPSGYQADTWHYTAGGSRILGARMALAVRSALFATGVDTTAPYLVGAQVANSDPTKIVITMSETLSASTPASSAFAVSGGKTVTGVAISGVTVTLTCSAPYTYSDTITVQYTKPGSGAMLQT